MKVMTRDEFREAVFKRDGYKCVVCGKVAQDAHHIIERRLFEDGGYHLDNGASLCGDCHIKAEETTLSPSKIRESASIQKVVLPSHLYPDYDYDKWGNIQNPNGTRYKGELFFDESVQKILKQGKVLDLFLKHIKYPRTYHLPSSMGRTNDDRALKDYSQFEGKEVVVTVKMDGENTTGYSDGYIHARSLDSQNHPSRNWVKNFLSSKLFELPEDWRICGENLYAKHSIHYRNLSSYFMMFSIWNQSNECLSWEQTVEWADLLGIRTVPTLYRGPFIPELIDKFCESYNFSEMEGFVIRSEEAFTYGDFKKNVAKFVRANHVQENKHWMKQSILKNELTSDKLDLPN